MTHQNAKLLTTPCIGKCSTTFGDDVCRGCRRFAEEIIQWNLYDQAIKQSIWIRLDRQIDQVLMPLCPNVNIDQLYTFIKNKKIGIPHNASKGRCCYAVIKFCYHFPSFTIESGLDIPVDHLKHLLMICEENLYQIATHEYKTQFCFY